MNTAVPQSNSPMTPETLLQRLDWRIIRRLDGYLQGDYRTLFYGDGIDFADLREYQLLDDIRHIDWNVTARMNTPYVRQYFEDREVTTWFLLDLSPSMGFGTLERSKSNVLIDFVITLARLLTRNGNRVGALLYSSQIDQTIPPRNGRNQVLRLARELMRQSDLSIKSPTDLNVLLNAGLFTIKRRSLIFLLSDFFSEPGWQRPLTLLNRRHDLVGIRLWDKREIELPNAGLIVVEDSETGEQLTIDTGDPVFRQRFFELAEQREGELRTQLKQSGVDLFSLSTEEDLVAAIIRMVAMRKRRRR